MLFWFDFLERLPDFMRKTAFFGWGAGGTVIPSVFCVIIYCLSECSHWMACSFSSLSCKHKYSVAWVCQPHEREMSALQWSVPFLSGLMAAFENKACVCRRVSWVEWQVVYVPELCWSLETRALLAPFFSSGLVTCCFSTVITSQASGLQSPVWFAVCTVAGLTLLAILSFMEKSQPVEWSVNGDCAVYLLLYRLRPYICLWVRSAHGKE